MAIEAQSGPYMDDLAKLPKDMALNEKIAMTQIQQGHQMSQQIPTAKVLLCLLVAAAKAETDSEWEAADEEPLDAFLAGIEDVELAVEDDEPAVEEVAVVPCNLDSSACHRIP